MPLFAPGNRTKSQAHRRLYALYEVVYTLVDMLAALCFVVGSIAFFFEAWKTFGTWNFLIGSVLFAAKPSLRLVRELHYLRVGPGRLAPAHDG
ncbi:YrhK family protein [Rhodobacteraceae bacterium ASV31]|nr:YrhK family protein [Anianabacter salinae]